MIDNYFKRYFSVISEVDFYEIDMIEEKILKTYCRNLCQKNPMNNLHEFRKFNCIDINKPTNFPDCKDSVTIAFVRNFAKQIQRVQESKRTIEFNVLFMLSHN